MSEGLEALHHPRIKSAKVDISAEGKHDIAYKFFSTTKQYAAIENELKDKEKQGHYIETLEDRLNNVETTCARYKQVLENIEESLKYGYVFIGYNKDNEPIFQFADRKLYEKIKKYTVIKRGINR